MIGIYVAAVLVCLASLLTGRALFALIGREDWTSLEGAVGLAALIVVAHVAISLPGGAIVAVVLLALLLVAAAVTLWRRRGAPPPDLTVAVAVALIVLLAAAIPFALNARTGVLGEGIYSNDHAVHLYWADWLQNEIGPKPKGIGWGYPVGPHALVAGISEGTGITAEDAFNGFMLAIATLTALTALGALRRLSPLPRIVAAVLVGLPFLTVSFLAQSSFKEMAIALFVLALALSLAALSREGPERAAAGPHPDRAVVVGIGVLAVASVLTFSVPGLAWFAVGVPLWVVAELIAGRLPFSPRAALARLRRAWPILAAGAVVIAVVAIVEAGTISRFADRIGEVQESQGRLAGRLPPWEVLGVWPRGDFRVATNAVDGAEVAILFGFLAAAVAAVWWLRRRELAVPAVLAGAFAIFLVARFTSGIHVEAKALIAAAPLVMLFILRGLLEDDRERDPGGRPRPGTMARIALGALFAGAAVLSSFLALRATPVGTSAHPDELGELRERVAGKEVAFLSLDRFAPYRLRDAERVQSPGGYVPNALRARKGKEWEQSEAIDFDTLETDVLDRFGYAVTTGAIYGSSAPENWSVVERTDNFVLWKRNGKDEPREILAEGAAPGKTAEADSPPCDVEPRGGAREAGTAGFWVDAPRLADNDPWRPDPEFAAGESARAELLLPEGAWHLSLQYNSEVPLTLRAGSGERKLERTLPAALDGMYANAPGKGPFWPAGELVSDGGTVEVEVTADEAPGLSRLVGAERHAWLGDLAAVRVRSGIREPHGPPVPGESAPVATAPLNETCRRYVDWYILER